MGIFHVDGSKQTTQKAQKADTKQEDTTNAQERKGGGGGNPTRISTGNLGPIIIIDDTHYKTGNE